ncbi:MAG: hypothetical protein L6R38_004092 [Xanthoria sp. 2 TBL-2021]|nr:MAG: hypothetical protein L6R38_004092 [Xanthoria sp. 2 TBL-2021]
MATNVDAKLLKQTKFPPEFSQKVDMKKVNVEVMKKWIAGKISEILGSEDDVVVELCFNLLERSRFPDIKVLQIQLTGFLDKDTPKFCKELWTLCLSAQSNPQGVPKELLEAKKLELIQEKIDAEKAAEEAQRQRDQERMRDKNIDNIRQRERAERGRGRGRGDRGYHDYDRRPPRHSRSPPPRRQRSPHPTDYRGPPPRDYVDTYIPGNRDARRRDPRPRSPPVRRPSRRSASRSRTPPSRRYRDDDPRPRRRRHSNNRSLTPVRQIDGRDRGQRTHNRRGDRARSFTPSDTSRSRSPRRPPRRRSPSTSSRSPSPRRSYHRKHGRTAPSSPSVSRSRSPSVERDRRRISRSRRSPSYTSDEVGNTRADARKGQSHNDGLRRSRSRNRSQHSTSKAPAKASGRGPSLTRQRDRKRRRSIERYAPAARRRRNTSSVSSPVEKRHKTADSSEEETNRPPPEPIGRSPDGKSTTVGRKEESVTRSPTQTANELREKLLREKVLALRRANISAKE